MGSGLATSFVSSFRTHGWISPDPMDLIEHAQVPQMGLSLILSDSGLRTFTLPILAFAFPSLGGLAGQLAIEG